MLERSRSHLLFIAALAWALVVPALAAGAAPLHWVRIFAPHAEVARAIPMSADAVDYGAFQWLGVDDATLAHLHAIGLRSEEASFELDLGGRRFDPVAGVPSFAGWDRIATRGADAPALRLIQFAAPIRQRDLDALRGDGVEPVQYIHPFTYVVWSSANALARASAATKARWSGDFLPAYRVLPRWRVLDATPIEVHVSAYRNAPGVEEALRSAGAIVLGQRTIDRRFVSIALRASGNRFADLAAVPGVYTVQPVPNDGGLRAEMSDQISAGNVGNDNFAFPGYRDYLDGIGLDGAGVVIADVDGGIYDTHPDLVNRMLPCTGSTCGGSATDSHGTHTAGIMAGDGSSGTTTSNGFLRGLGMAPGANLIEQLYSPFYTQAGGMLLLMTQSERNGAVMSGNSWGPAGSPHGYDDDTRQVDVGVRDADPDAPGDQPFHYVLSFMNGNGGVSTQGTPDEAKNIFTIGSTWGQNSPTAQNPDIDDISANSAHGPALDGRSIPALVAPGCEIDSSISATGYGLLCGTSMASPHVTGASALFVERYRNLTGVDPSPALIKAAFTAVAKNLTGNHDADGNTLTHLFDSKQGWGRLQIDPVLAPQQAVQYVDQTTVFNNSGESWTHTYTAADAGQPIRIMLAWTDAPGHGLGGSTPAWNNDLDLSVTTATGTYLGNVLSDAGWSEAGGSADEKNNTEAVFLEPAQHAGSVTIEVVATDINSDALPNSGDATDQDFALVCYNCVDDTSVADLSVAASASPDPVAAGAMLEYTIAVANAGPVDASGVHVDLTPDPLVDFASASGSGWSCTFTHGAASCDLSTPVVAGGDAPPLTIDVGVPASAAFATLTSTVGVSSKTADSNSTNNTVEVVTGVIDRIFGDGFDG